MHAIFTRTSIRKFENKPVEARKVEKLLRAAMVAPSAGDQRPWEFYVVEDPKILAQLALCSPYAGCTKNAPMAFVACSRKEAYFPENVQMDMSAAVENLLLEAVELGLGAVWLGIAPLEDRMAATAKAIALPESLEAFAIIPCGYPVAIEPQEDRFEEARVHYIPAK